MTNITCDYHSAFVNSVNCSVDNHVFSYNVDIKPAIIIKSYYVIVPQANDTIHNILDILVLFTLP